MKKSLTPNKRHGSRHHADPRSRIPKKLRKIKRPWNIIEKSAKEHLAWHHMFNNRLICEAIDMICQGKMKVPEEVYRIVFGNKDPVTVITKEWAPRHPKAKCFQFKECFELHDSKKVCPLLRLNEKGELI